MFYYIQLFNCFIGSLFMAKEFLNQPACDDLLGLYLQDTKEFPLLKPEEEIFLAKQIKLGQACSKKLALNRASKTQKEELEAIIRQGHEAKKILIQANLRLVTSVAKKYLWSNLELIHLIQAGNIGLIRAVSKYDHRRGQRFSTPAKWWIEQAIQREISDFSQQIRIPVYTGEQISRLKKQHKKLQQELNRDPTIEELAQATNIKQEKIEFFDKINHQKPISLEAPTNEESETAIINFIPDGNLTPNQIADLIDTKEQLNLAMSFLSPVEERVLKLSYGYKKDGENQSLKKIHHQLGPSRETIRGIRKRALKRMSNLVTV